MNPLLAEGLTDAIGFVLGALIAYGAAKLVGLDPLAEGSGTGTLFAIIAVGIGGGVGVRLARLVRAAHFKKRE